MKLRNLLKLQCAMEILLLKRHFEAFTKENPSIEEVIALPLYPHYAMSSYETAVEYAKEIHKKKKYSFKLTFIEPFYRPDY